MYHFATYFDNNYLPRALALRDSLERHAPGFTLHCLCLDDQCYRTLTETRPVGVVPIRLEDFEAANPGLRDTRSDRSWAEYCFTCAGVLPRFVLQANPSAETVALVDADIYFFSSPAPMYEEMQGYSLGLIEHRFTRPNMRAMKYGRFNVGWIGFRNDATGIAAAEWWADRCIDWCYDRLEGDKFADQKYLEQFPVLFGATRIIEHKGANVAPWNIGRYRLGLNGSQVTVDGVPLIFFHFASFKQIRPWLFNTSFGPCFVAPSRIARREIFGPYIRDLQRNAPALVATQSARKRHPGPVRASERVRRALRLVVGLAFREYIVMYRGRVL